jgi:hypothetical protein
MNGPVKRAFMGQGCKPPLCNGNDLDYTIIVQVNRCMVYEIEDVQMVEPKTETVWIKVWIDEVSTWSPTPGL